jgi:predicted transcriptional regulator
MAQDRPASSLEPADVPLIEDDHDEVSRPTESPATIAAIRQGLEQAERGQFATDEQVREAFARFRKS